MRQNIIYIFLLNIFRMSSQNAGDPQCTTTCTADCEASCPEAVACPAGKQDCGGVANANPFCPALRICVDDHCECQTQSNTGETCALFCNIECSESEKYCEGGRDSSNCKLPDTCVTRPVNADGGLCPGYCPVTCETNQILCPVAQDADGCEQAPVCEAKGEDKDGAACPGVCPVTCTEENILCSGKVLESGCKEVDTCVFKGRTNDDTLCPGTCHVHCNTNEILCPGPEMPDGCHAADECRVMAKDDTGKVCPANSASHQCPKTCKDDEVLCPASEDQTGCKGEEKCVKKAEDNLDPKGYCPAHSVCHSPCKVNELSCSAGVDEKGCKNPDTCLAKSRDNNGEICPINCPGDCKENEIKCEGATSEEGCKGPDICVPVGTKLQAPNPEEVGTPCPGYCPIHECASGSIKCPAQVEPCFLCKTEEVCRVAAKDIDGVFCPESSASHDCPTFCNEAAGEVLCPAYEDERGCKPKAVCIPKVKDDNDNDCPEHSVCPLVCKSDEMVCPHGDDINGCKKADSCEKRGEDRDGNLCPVQCPPVCGDNQNLCSGEIMENGCNAASVCVAKVLGNGGAHCRTICPVTCEANKERVSGGTDDNGCPVEDTCKVPKTFSAWTNNGACVANGDVATCGPGTQAQARTCTDGEIDKCTDSEELARTVSCAVAGSELPNCPEPFTGDILQNGGKLLSDGEPKELSTEDGVYKADMQGDGNFVIYKNGGALWASNTANIGNGPFKLHMQSDNNVAVYDKDDAAKWTSGTATSHISASTGYLRMQADGNLVIYRGDGLPLWKSGTYGGASSTKMGTGYLLTDCIKDDQNASGNDLADMPVTVSNAGECQNGCRNNGDCKYFSFRASDGQCWLKTTGDTLAAETGITSGPIPCAAETEG